SLLVVFPESLVEQFHGRHDVPGHDDVRHIRESCTPLGDTGGYGHRQPEHRRRSALCSVRLQHVPLIPILESPKRHIVAGPEEQRRRAGSTFAASAIACPSRIASSASAPPTATSCVPSQANMPRGVVTPSPASL